MGRDERIFWCDMLYSDIQAEVSYVCTHVKR